MSTEKICVIVACGNELSENSELDTCPTCRASFSYWRRKRPAQRVARRAALTKYADRLDNLPEKGGRR